MDTVCPLQYEPGVLLGKSIYFIFTGFHIELLAHSQKTHEILKTDSNQPLNLSVSVLYHGKNQGNKWNFPNGNYIPSNSVSTEVHSQNFPFGPTCQSFYF